MVLPEVNSTTLNPWIQPYSYATPKSTVHNTPAVEGVLSQPALVTTISPIFKASLPTITSNEKKSAINPNNGNIWGEVNIPKHRYEYNKENTGKEELLFPPERFKIVEENLHYKIKVNQYLSYSILERDPNVIFDCQMVLFLKEYTFLTSESWLSNSYQT